MTMQISKRQVTKCVAKRTVIKEIVAMSKIRTHTVFMKIELPYFVEDCVLGISTEKGNCISLPVLFYSKSRCFSILQVWNNELAAVAQKYAQKCVFAHNSLRSKQSPSFFYVGENLAISTSRKANYTAMAELWNNEVINYNYDSGTCSGVCGHYTQVCERA